MQEATHAFLMVSRGDVQDLGDSRAVEGGGSK